MVSDNKGLNLPGVAVSASPPCPKRTVDDLRWALRCGADIVALSFVRSAATSTTCTASWTRKAASSPSSPRSRSPQAVENLEEIVDAFDGIMVARGDLGVELPLEQVPLVQKRAIELARRNAKPVIVATQMLESMIDNSAPHPRRGLRRRQRRLRRRRRRHALRRDQRRRATRSRPCATMARIIENTEEHGLERIPPLGTAPRTKGGAITRAAAEIGELLGAKFLVAFTQSGDTARRMSRLRSRIPLLAFTPEPATRSQLALSLGRGDVPRRLRPAHRRDGPPGRQRRCSTSAGAHEGDLVVIVAGSPARHPRLHQRAARAPDGRRGRPPRARLRATPHATSEGDSGRLVGWPRRPHRDRWGHRPRRGAGAGSGTRTRTPKAALFESAMSTVPSSRPIPRRLADIADRPTSPHRPPGRPLGDGRCADLSPTRWRARPVSSGRAPCPRSCP